MATARTPRFSARTIRGYYGGVTYRVIERTGHGFGRTVASPDTRAEADAIAARLNEARG